MKRIPILLIAFLTITQTCFSKQWLIFNASKMSLSPLSLGGHTYVSFIKENSLIKQTILVGCWGFYAKSGIGAFGYVEGEIRDDRNRQKDVSLMIEVTEPEFDLCLSTKNEWETKKYKLTAQNCVDFVREIVNNISKLNQPSFLDKFPDEYIENLKLLNKSFEVTQTIPTSANNTNSSPAEKQKIKNAAIAFYKWDESVWETSATAMKLQNLKMILNKQGKPEEEDGYGCPCTINWKEVNTFFTWMQSRGSIIGSDYIMYLKNAVKDIEEKMKNAKTTKENLEIIEAFYIDGMFNLFPGNAGAPKFSQSGIYGSSAIWEIDINPDGTAYVNTTFKMPDDWFDKVGAYKLKMVKENGAWKLAAPVEEGKISPSFLK